MGGGSGGGAASSPMNPKTVNLIQLNVAVLLWGGTAMFAKGITLPVEHIICGRSWVAAAALLPLALVAQQVRLKSLSQYGIMIALGLLLGIHWLTYFQALKVSTAAVAILALHTYPVFTTLLEPFLFGEKLRGVDVAIAVAVFVGILVMMPELSLANATTQGVVLGIVSGLFFMARNLMTRKYVQRYSSSTLMFWQTLVIGIALLPTMLVAPGQTYSTLNLTLVVVLGLLFTALPHTLFTASFRNLSAKTASILAALLPFYGAVLGYFIHKETVTPRTMIGGAIILGSVIYETVRNTGSNPRGAS